MMPIFSIVIPTHKHLDVLKKCCESIIKFTNLSDKEIVVVANGCGDDGTKEYVESLGSPFKLIEFDKALGYAKATNEGIKIATGEFIVLLNNDCEILWGNNDWINILSQPFENPKIGMTGVHEIYSDEIKHNFLVFHCVMIRKKVFDEIGLLDEMFGSFGEDIDFTARLLNNGYTYVNVEKNSEQKETMKVGTFPLYHQGSTTVHDENHSVEYEKIVQRNLEILKRRYDKTIKRPKYSIVIPSFNQCDKLLKPALESLIEATDLSDVEVIVVANGCTDNTEEYVNSLGEPFRVLVYKDQLGYPKATNIGLKDALGEFIVFLNNDVVLYKNPKGWLNILREPFDSGRKIGMTGVMLFIGDANFSNDFIMFFCAMTTRKVIDEVGLLDENFGLGGVEDVDYGLRLILAGYELVEVPNDGKTKRSSGMSSGTFPIFHAGCSTVSKEKDWDENLKRNNEYLKKKFPNYFKGIDWIEEMSDKPKIYDAFLFFNELDLLELRFKELNDTVDFFVITEATITHQGNPKPLYFKENEKRFEKYKDKIIYILVDHFPVFNEDDWKKPWDREQWQRHCLIKGLTNCKDNDVIILSDADEIPNVEAIKNYKGGGIKSLEQNLYYYDFHHLAEKKWTCAKIMQFKDVKEGKTKIQDNNPFIFSTYLRNEEHEIIKNGGWHFSYLADTKGIINKLKSFSHREFNTHPYTEEEYIRQCIDKNKNLFSDDVLSYVEIDNSYPKTILDNINKYKSMGFIKSDGINYSELHKIMQQTDVGLYHELFQLNVNQLERKDIEGKTIIDIGGNKGYFSIQCMEMGAKETYCFEPVKSIYGQLLEITKNIKEINPYNLAVLDGSISEVHMHEDGMASNIWGQKSSEPIKCISFVEAMSHVIDTSNMILKLDCEGSEFEIVLNSPKELIRKFSTIYIEIHDEMNPNYVHKTKELLDYIENLGFNLKKGLQAGVYAPDGSFTPSPICIYKCERIEHKSIWDNENISIDRFGAWNTSHNDMHHIDESLCNSLISFLSKNNYSVYDFGCGYGEYIKKFKDNSIICKGYDGNKEIKTKSNGLCEQLNLAEKFKMDKLDVVMSLEVGEHIPKEYEDVFIENLHNHNSKYIILSWAIEGQFGLGHVNEKSNNYIKDKIIKLGYENDIVLENELRKSSTFAWFKNTIMVFRKSNKFTIGYINHSSDDYEKYLEPSLRELNENEYEIISFTNKNNPARTYNQIIEHSKNKYIILLHQDVIFPPTFLDSIKKTIEAHPDFGVLGLVGFDEFANLNRFTLHSTPNQTHKVDFFDSCCIVINKENNIKFDDVIFDDFHLYVEDYCMQAKEKGLSNYTILADYNKNDDCKIKHFGTTYFKNGGKMWGRYDEYYSVFLKKWIKKLHATLRTDTLNGTIHHDTDEVIKPRVCIVILATGNYGDFAKNLVESINWYFMTDCYKDILLLSDTLAPMTQRLGENCVVHTRRCKSVRKASYFFELMLENLDIISKADYCYKMDADMIIYKNILGNEILPSSEQNYSIVKHFAFDQKRMCSIMPDDFSAKIPIEYQDCDGWQSCLFGGRTTQMIELAKELNQKIVTDRENNKMWGAWEEPYVNWYLALRKKEVRTLSPTYATPLYWHRFHPDYKEKYLNSVNGDSEKIFHFNHTVQFGGHEVG